MATNEAEVERKKSTPELKHLGFVRIAAIQALVCVSNLYDYAKKNSGPLRSTVRTVEGTVSGVLGPVYRKLKGVPDDLLVFVDSKVDVATQKFDERAPPFAKHVVSQAKDFLEKVTEKAEKVVKEAQTGGPRAAAQYAVTESKQFVLINTVKLWNGVNKYPSVHAVADMAVPTVAYWSKRYNHVIKDMTGKGYTVFGYLPSIPLDEIARAFKQEESKMKEDEPASAEHKAESSGSGSD
ncbi:REF/SRPP-like protein [Senna tora]|uniref:REF/SRPP-like protein n=1 Tax=Senna tora TaxID=362788 RepID=A0A834W7Y2_9FABA|nr:REF/SRPP-like protein [Senna tora]